MLSAVAEVVERVLTFESDHSEELLQYDVGGIHLYPIVRTGVLDIEYQLIGAERPHGSTRDARNRAADCPLATQNHHQEPLPADQTRGRRSSDHFLCVKKSFTKQPPLPRHLRLHHPDIGCSSLMLEHPFPANIVRRRQRDE